MRVQTIPSYANELQYRKALRQLIEAMVKDVAETFRMPTMIEDAKPQTVAQKIKLLRKRWYYRFERAGKELATWSVNSANKRTQKQVQRKMSEIGFTFKPEYTEEQKNVISAITDENVSYIKSIPQQYLKRLQSDLTGKYGYSTVPEIIQEAVERGGDRNYLAKKIYSLGEISKEHANNIARDQINKATQTLAVFNAKAIGARQGRWIHIPGKYGSRLSHIHMNGKVFNLDKGLYDEAVGKNVMPAELPYCQCQFEILLPGLEGGE